MTSTPELRTLNAAGYIVRWRGYGVKFHTNLCGRVYSLVTEAEATQFDSPVEALRKCVEMNLKVREVEIVTIEKS